MTKAGGKDLNLYIYKLIYKWYHRLANGPF